MPTHLGLEHYKKHYRRIEIQNQIAINVLGYEKGEKFPLYITDERYPETLDLLLISRDAVQHYVLIQVLIVLCTIIPNIKSGNTSVDIAYNAFQVNAH